MIIMHVISVLIGAAFPYLLSKTATEIICVVLFFGFGVYMVYQAIFDADDDVILIITRVSGPRKGKRRNR